MPLSNLLGDKTTADYVVLWLLGGRRHQRNQKYCVRRRLSTPKSPLTANVP
ncbi:hypothetical protein KCP75_04040 [Salmonella enterica subsp. enterica]|nr:hypothetical protein KCP75_04040 [Salmonella enterica subsp. enterica]